MLELDAVMTMGFTESAVTLSLSCDAGTMCELPPDTSRGQSCWWTFRIMTMLSICGVSAVCLQVSRPPLFQQCLARQRVCWPVLATDDPETVNLVYN